MVKCRDYKKETAAMVGFGKFSECTPYQKANRIRKSNRSKARAHINKERLERGQPKLPKLLEVDHKNGNALDNRRKNLQVMHRHKNRVKG